MNPVQQNPLLTRQDMVRAAADLLRPLVNCMSPGKSRLVVGEGAAYYSEDVAGMEGFSRPLWAILPLLMGKCPEAEEFWPLWREGLIHGTDPAHPEYWGDLTNYDQKMVEMAVLGAGLCFAPDAFYRELSPRQQDNLYRWLNQINQHEMHGNNWRYFRILVNAGFLTVGRPADEKKLRDDLDMMETHYVGNGWYFDYPTKRDYYTLWGFHFNSLLYAAVMEDRDRERCQRFRERAKLIAPRFACWFDREGRGIPYGRSVLYRMAQSAFFAALAFAGVDVPEMDWGQIKGLLLRNVRFWLRQPIFDRGGALTVGYGYPNLCASEGYSAPGSPYWALIAFWALALPEAHPFWQAEEKPFSPPEMFLDEQVRLLLTRDPDNRQVIAYTAGNHAWEHTHEDEKYEKFAYSTHFAYSVSREVTSLPKGAFDSMLAIRRMGKDLWRVRSGCDSFSLSSDRVTFAWAPADGVHIHTVIVPLGKWHVRKHVIRTEFPLEAAEGAFSVKKDWAGSRPCDRIASVLVERDRSAAAHGAFGTSAIFALKGFARGQVIHPEANTNLMHPRTVLPQLYAWVDPGETTLICAVYGDPEDSLPDGVPQDVLAIAETL